MRDKDGVIVLAVRILAPLAMLGIGAAIYATSAGFLRDFGGPLPLFVWAVWFAYSIMAAVVFVECARR